MIHGNPDLSDINRLLQLFGYSDRYDLDAIRYVSDVGLEAVAKEYRNKTLMVDRLDDLEKQDLDADVWEINREIAKRNLSIPLIQFELNWEESDINAVIARLGVN
jgi:hypothetical protein